jgi:uncharacterized membrane protein YdfJ with MMPL/SSD domain
MSFSVVVGISLDYDIFLLSRVMEFRQQGYNTHDAIVLGLAKSGHVITSAGLIMALAFSGASLLSDVLFSLQLNGICDIGSLFIDVFQVCCSAVNQY